MVRDREVSDNGGKSGSADADSIGTVVLEALVAPWEGRMSDGAEAGAQEALAEKEPLDEGPAPFPETIPFPPEASSAPAKMCSFFECMAGHFWPARLAVTACPGCKTARLASKRENCPFCNEPQLRLTIQADHLVPGMPLGAVCQGQLCHPNDISSTLTMQFELWGDASTEKES